MKKVLLTTILLAAGSAVAESALTGIHLGVDAGLQRADFNQYLDTGNPAIGTSNHNKIKNPSYPFVGSAFFGYFKDSGDVYYGAQVSFGTSFDKREKKVADNALYTSIKTKIDQQYSLALTGKLGTYVSQDMVVYGLLGVKRVRYDLEVNATSVALTQTSPRSTVGKTLWGPVVGLGLKKALSDAWAFQTELSYEFYQKTKTGNLVSSPARIVGMSMQPRIWNLSVGLSRKF